jgi:predicted transcriptional regulator
MARFNSTKSNLGLEADVHFRAPSDFISKVHEVARAKGMTASNFMRAAIIEAVNRESIRYAPDTYVE